MWPYWMMFLVPAIAALTEGTGARNARRPGRSAQMQWLVVWGVLALLVGLRWRVGGDWANYEAMLDAWQGIPLSEAIRSTELGFGFLSWISLQLGWGLIGVNMMTAPLFALALVQFCRSLPRPWLALAISVPYLVIVVAMGYTRQGLALACCMLGLLALGRGSVRTFLAWIVLGALFHRTAVLLLPIAALLRNPNVFLKINYVLLILVTAYFVALSDKAAELYENYVVAEYQSEGALVRLLMNALPAVLFLAMSRRFRLAPVEAAVWQWFSWISLLLLAVLFATNASTAVDRVALYMLPLQLVVFSRLPGVVAQDSRARRACIAAVVIYYALVLFTWLNFSTHAQYWIPFRLYPFD